MDSFTWLQNFHLIRPYWLLALLPLAVVIWLYRRQRSRSGLWSSVVDPRLLPHLIQAKPARQTSFPVSLLFVLGSLVIFALAGPAFEKRPQPVYRAQSGLLIVLDLSRSMNAQDIRPSRLERAHYKINDILKQRKEGQTGLIVYAADAFVVSPLTDDAHTISAQVSALQTDIMPAQGSRLDLALQKARELFQNAGQKRGHIIVISDSIDAAATRQIESLKNDHYLTSVLAIGTRAGAPIPSHQGGFLKDQSGAIVVPGLDITKMQAAARTGGGQFSLLTADDRDIQRLLSAIDIERPHNQPAETSPDGAQLKADTWFEEGPWLLLLVIPFAAYAFRRGIVFLLVFFILPPPEAQALDFDSLWMNEDQRAASLLQQGHAEQASELFTDREWKAAAHYKAGQYQQTSELLKDIDSADAQYNRGNALAKSGQLPQALEAYQRALELDPQHEDARYNQALVEKALQQPSTPQDNNQSQPDQQSKDADKPQDAQPSSGQSQPQQDSEQQATPSQPQNAGNDQASQPQPAHDKKDADKQEAMTQEQASAASETQDEQTPEPQQQTMVQPDDASPDLDQQKTQQWLKKIPDDPGGLLRRKFKYQYGRDNPPAEPNPW